RIEEERVRRRGRPDEILEQATVRYVYEGRHYESRHSLPGPSRRHQVGQRLPIVLLPDEPARSYAVHELTGNWLLALFLP
ncbi:DUF3592 domain-containing protein, partial [Enterococcus casseliflavus]|uniref:DUF3592 domain-containing protein n=1 Tax=Enterococcus casseliflavus TaxID=37734 RepID=UPI003D141E1B